jgi:undecaprenyl diphosphate synthase
MDGNGRWAAQRGLTRGQGHQAGAEPVRVVLKAAKKAGVKILTLYAYSTENWGRPQDEVRGLFELLWQYLESETPELQASGVRLRAIGDISALPDFARRSLAAAQELTKGNEDLTLSLALSYGSRAELTLAARRLAEAAAAGRLDPAEITPERLTAELWTADLPDPDLLIRTGGDMRLSNFLLWQCAYTEFYFTPTLWPDFGADEFQAALNAYAGRERRYGLADTYQDR